jgi:AbiV family abortive infection protein
MSPEDLFKNPFYALEQSGLLLRDANILYRRGSYATTIVLAAFAREELGRYRILLDLWRRACTGEVLSVKQIQQRCDNHETKQKAGMLSTTMRADRDSGLGKILRASLENPPQSSAAQEARATLKTIDRKEQKRTPDDRHGQRMSALYVEPESETRWNRPDDTSAMARASFSWTL